MTGRSLWGATSRLLLLSFPTFIMLSAAIITDETRKCHWCGPLADQVHRSRRAPACDMPANYVTACEPGLSYCAVVATSPPYVESRLCVKLYQDECYPLFCNSTKTWKMTCPCQGDLCNGPNTEREIEAFDILAKLVAKTRTTRIKKRTQVNTVKFIPSGDERTVIITNISALESNEFNNSLDTGVKDDKVTHIILPDDPMANLEEKEEEIIMSTHDANATEDAEEQSTELVGEMIAETTEDTPQELENHTEKILDITEKDMDRVAKPSEELPTAEALQQTASPKVVSEKTTVPPTSSVETTYQTITDSDIEMTTEVLKADKKNGTGKLYITNFFNIVIYLSTILARSFKHSFL